MLTCCFTGSRPQNLPWCDDSDPRCQSLLSKLEAEIKKAIERGYLRFMSGMAIGIDTYAARIVLRLRDEYPTLDIMLEAVIPCPNQDKLWSEIQKKEYARLLEKCDKRTFSSNYYSKYCFQKRNEYMVERSSLVIAVTDGRNGGTMNTIKYARSKNKKIIILEP